MPNSSSERGAVLVVVLLTLTLMAALGAALTLATTTELAIAANYREASEALYAAEAGVAFVLQEAAAVADWSDVATGPGQSAFVDGAPEGVRMVGGIALDLTDETTRLESSAPPGLGAAWVLHAFGPLDQLVPSTLGRPVMYVAVWLANYTDSSDESRRGTLSIVGSAYGPRGSRQFVEVVVERADATTLRRRSWRQWP